MRPKGKQIIIYLLFVVTEFLNKIFIDSEGLYNCLLNFKVLHNPENLSTNLLYSYLKNLNGPMWTRFVWFSIDFHAKTYETQCVLTPSGKYSLSGT